MALGRHIKEAKKEAKWKCDTRRADEHGKEE